MARKTKDSLREIHWIIKNSLLVAWAKTISNYQIGKNTIMMLYKVKIHNKVLNLTKMFN
jgi:hypothetical protein